MIFIVISVILLCLSSLTLGIVSLRRKVSDNLQIKDENGMDLITIDENGKLNFNAPVTTEIDVGTIWKDEDTGKDIVRYEDGKLVFEAPIVSDVQENVKEFILSGESWDNNGMDSNELIGYAKARIIIVSEHIERQSLPEPSQLPNLFSVEIIVNRFTNLSILVYFGESTLYGQQQVNIIGDIQLVLRDGQWTIG